MNKLTDNGGDEDEAVAYNGKRLEPDVILEGCSLRVATRERPVHSWASLSPGGRRERDWSGIQKIFNAPLSHFQIF